MALKLCKGYLQQVRHSARTHAAALSGQFRAFGRAPTHAASMFHPAKRSHSHHQHQMAGRAKTMYTGNERCLYRGRPACLQQLMQGRGSTTEPAGALNGCGRLPAGAALCTMT